MVAQLCFGTCTDSTFSLSAYQHSSSWSIYFFQWTTQQ